MPNVVTVSTSSQDPSGPFHPPNLFFLLRTLLLGSIFFLSFAWSILLCVAIFVQWVNMNLVERTMISIILFIEVLTIILVPVLLAKEFRLWLDAARSLFIFASHFGIAVWFACKAPAMKCAAAGEQAVCTSLILSILVFTWVIPSLVIFYSCGLGYLFFRISKLRPPTPTATTPTKIYADPDVNKHQTMASHGSFYTNWNASRVSSGYAV